MIKITLNQYIFIHVCLAAVLVYRLYPIRAKSDRYECPDLLNSTLGCFDRRNYRSDFTLDPGGTLPYVSGANLMLFADFVHDRIVRNVIIDELKDGDVIYVKGDFVLNFFRTVFPKITKKFILVTHNSDYPVKGKFVKYLENRKLIAWFGENPTFEHPKLIPTPMGIENPNWYPAKTPFVRSLNLSSLVPWEKRKYLLYINFSAHTNKKKRQPLLDYFKQFDFVFINQKKVDYASYMGHVGDSKYVLCPPGNAIDTHRYYETLLMGAIPVVENSTLYTLFKETSSFVIDDLLKLTVDMLKNPGAHITNMNFSRKLLLWSTWAKKINAARSGNLEF
jgi:hypothetical protein